MPTRARDIVLTDSARRWLRWIGVWQIAGGIFAAITFLDSIRRFPDSGAFAPTVLGAGILIALIAVAAGLALRQHRAEGLMPSMVVQLLQVLGIATNSVFLQFILGPSLALNLIGGQTLQLQAAFRPVLQVHLAPPFPITPGIAINVLALLCFLKLLSIETRDVLHDAPAPLTAVEQASPESTPNAV